MENISNIAYLVFVCVGICAYVITTVLAIKRKRAAGETVDLNSVYDELMGKCVTLIECAEKAYKELSDKSGIKAGAFKLEYVLNRVRAACDELKVNFDSTYWTERINKLVELMNTQKNKVQSTELKAISNDTVALVSEGEEIVVPTNCRLSYHPETNSFTVIKKED